MPGSLHAFGGKGWQSVFAKQPSCVRHLNALATTFPRWKSKEAVETLFDVMKGAKPVRDAAVLLPSQKVLHDVPPKTSNKDWLMAEAWCGRWTRQKYMVEAHNRTSKSGKAPEPLAVALMSLYKKDMVAVLEGLAENAGISTSYVDRNPAAREKRTKRANIARRKRQANDVNDAQGPPNRNSDFKKPKTRKRKVLEASQSDQKQKQGKGTAPESSQSLRKKPKLTNVSDSDGEDCLELPVQTTPSKHLRSDAVVDLSSTPPSADPVIDLTSTPPSINAVVDLDLVPTPPSRPPWIPEFELFLDDKEHILSGSWLLQQHITAAQALLKQKFSQQNGLQNTVDVADLRYSCSADNFVQIVNLRNTHWVCVSNLNCKPDEVDIYDSLYATPCYTLKEQVAAILRSPAERITLHMVNMQRQNGGADCGLFAVSTAVSLCHGEDPAAHVKEQSQMREHFICCLENRDMVVFPDSDKPVRTKRRIKSECAVSVLCKCRLPWKRTSKSRSMAECSKCKRWYHQDCENIPPAVFSDSGAKWLCNYCL